MDRPAIKTLILPFERQDRPLPEASAPWLFLNAAPLPDSSKWTAGLNCQQGFRPTYLALQNAGYAVEPKIVGNNYSGALILTDRARAVNEAHLMQAITSLQDNAPIMVAGEKNSGISPLKKFASRFGEVVDSFSKHHAQCFTIHSTLDAKQKAMAHPIDPASGIFAKGKVDKGSALLITTLNKEIEGQVADFCSGAGVLAMAIVQQCTPSSLTLLEADYRALEHSRSQFAHHQTKPDIHWLDLTSETSPGRYDWIIMNPPFHVSREANPALGQSLIRAAKKALGPGGKLRLVANRTLPYEKTMEATFGNFVEITAEGGFKVLQSRA